MSPARRTALIFGVLYLATFVFSIAGVLLYNPVLHPARFMAGAGGDTRVRLGAVSEVLLIIANIGTALVVYPIFRRRYEVLSLGYVTARLAECTFIAIGIVSYLAVVTLHQQTRRRGRRRTAQRREIARCGSQLDIRTRPRPRQRADPWLHDVQLRPDAERSGDVGAHRRRSHLHYGPSLGIGVHGDRNWRCESPKLAPLPTP